MLAGYHLSDHKFGLQIYIFYGTQNQHLLLGTLKKTDTDETLLPQLFVLGIVK